MCFFKLILSQAKYISKLLDFIDIIISGDMCQVPDIAAVEVVGRERFLVLDHLLLGNHI